LGSLCGDAFLSKKGFYCYAFNAEGRRVPEPTPWNAFGLFWGLGEEDKARRTLAWLNGKEIPFHEVRTERAVRAMVRFSLSGEDRVDLVLKLAVEIVPPYVFSETGDLSRGLRIIDLTGNENRLELLLEGLAGENYYRSLQNSHLVDSVKGADLEKGRLKITFPAAAKPGYVEQKVVLLCR
jgi:hypothetical protein